MKYRMKHAPMGWNSYDYYDTTVTGGRSGQTRIIWRRT